MKERFRGSYIAKIDDRGRVKIPAKYLSALETDFGKEVYLTSVNGDHVLFYPMTVWQEIEKKDRRHPHARSRYGRVRQPQQLLGLGNARSIPRAAS